MPMAEPDPYPVDWRGVLNELNVDWVDRGPNCSKDNININCPACGDDDGHHLRISEQYEIWNCWRNPQHGGRAFPWLLMQLGCTRTEAVRLLNYYRGTFRPPPPAPAGDHGKAWKAFYPIANAPAGHPVWAYLCQRGFTDPHRLASTYDLRYAKAGPYNARVLIPMPWLGTVSTWTGRTILPGMLPRYKVGGAEDAAAIYIPRPPRAVCYLVEGHLDALKIASGFEGTQVSAVAIGGMDLNPGRILRLQQLGVQELRLMLDATVGSHMVFRMIKELATHLRTCNVVRWRLPPPYKDAGEVPQSEIKHLLG
jgi:hypothetical protein